MDATLFCETDPTYFDFKLHVRQFGELPAPGYDGMKAGEVRNIY